MPVSVTATWPNVTEGVGWSEQEASGRVAAMQKHTRYTAERRRQERAIWEEMFIISV
jgi:hypothetical protein